MTAGLWSRTRSVQPKDSGDGDKATEVNLMEQLRQKRKPGVVNPQDCNHDHAVLESIAMTQHSRMKKGIKLFGQVGVDAVLKELKQLHDRKVLKPKMVSELTVEGRKAALEYLMFLKKKRCGTIKMCQWTQAAGVHQQRGGKFTNVGNQIGDAGMRN